MYRTFHSCHKAAAVASAVSRRASKRRPPISSSVMPFVDGSPLLGWTLRRNFSGSDGYKSNNRSRQRQHHHQRRRQQQHQRQQRPMFPPAARPENPFEILGITKNITTNDDGQISGVRYEDVKRRFIELALRYHPDLASSSSSSKNMKSSGGDGDSDGEGDDTASGDDHAHLKYNTEQFIRFRQAFEAIKETHDGGATVASEDDVHDDYYGNISRTGSRSSTMWTSDDEFKAWFYEETEHSDVMFKMHLSTRKQVIDLVHENQSQGGLDKGGMWEMARNMARQQETLVRHQKDNFGRPTSIALESGSNSSSSGQRRRRKR